jgi:hypothetical protein
MAITLLQMVLLVDAADLVIFSKMDGSSIFVFIPPRRLHSVVAAIR